MAVDHQNKRFFAGECKAEELGCKAINDYTLEVTFNTPLAYALNLFAFQSYLPVNQKIYDRNVVYELAQGYLDGTIKSRIEPMIEKKSRFGHDYYANIHQFSIGWRRHEKKRSAKENERLSD